MNTSFHRSFLSVRNHSRSFQKTDSKMDKSLPTRCKDGLMDRKRRSRISTYQTRSRKRTRISRSPRRSGTSGDASTKTTRRDSLVYLRRQIHSLWDQEDLLDKNEMKEKMETGRTNSTQRHQPLSRSSQNQSRTRFVLLSGTSRSFTYTRTRQILKLSKYTQALPSRHPEKKLQTYIIGNGFSLHTNSSRAVVERKSMCKKSKNSPHLSR